MFDLRDDVLGRASIKRAGGDQKGRLIRVQSVALPRAGPIDAGAKQRINRDAGNGHARSRQSQRFEMRFRLIDRDEVAIKGPGKPHRVTIEIGHHHGQVRAQLFRFDQMRDDARRHEMRADGDVRIELPDELHQRPGVQPIDPQPHRVRFPRLVARAIGPAKKRRGGTDDGGVAPRVNVAKELVGKVQRVFVHDFRHAIVAREGFRQRRARGDMAGSCAGRDDKDARLHCCEMRPFGSLKLGIVLFSTLPD